MRYGWSGLRWRRSAGCQWSSRLRHDLERFVFFLRTVQSQVFRRNFVEHQEEEQGNQERGRHEPRQQAVTPVGLSLGNEEIEVIADAHSAVRLKFRVFHIMQEWNIRRPE